MMKNDIFRFFQLERQIFGTCPKCNNFFRLSDCSVFLREKRTLDWLDELRKKQKTVDRAEERLNSMKVELQEKARVKGRGRALKVVRRIDTIFTPRKLNPDDAKVIFHPVDYVVFNGMKEKDAIKNIILLDRERKDGPSRKLQKSIEKSIESGNYEWKTIIIDEGGKIRYK